MINGEDSEAEKRDILMEFIQNMAPDDKAIIFFCIMVFVYFLYIFISEMLFILLH